MSERRTAIKRHKASPGTPALRRRYRAARPKKITTLGDLAAYLASTPPISHEAAEILREAMRWCRGEGEFDDECTS
jgi:hypothetical protein